MITLTKLLEQNIKKLTSDLKSEDELLSILKRKLTKKEFKIMNFILEDSSKEIQLQKLSLDEKRYEEVYTKLFKKLNYNEIKQELMQ